MFKTSGFGPSEANACFLPSFHEMVRRQARGPYGIISLECAPRASSRDDRFPISHFLLYQFLGFLVWSQLQSCALAAWDWAMLILNIQWCN